MNILEYELADPIETGLNTIIYRAYKATQDTTVIFKVLASPSPTIKDLIKFRNEYKICKNLDISGIVKPLALTDYQASLALVGFAKILNKKLPEKSDRYLTQPIDTEKLFENIGALLSKGASKKNLLVVDEDARAVKTLVDVLEAKEYRVVEAATGQECIEKAMAIGPDMIILNSVLSEHHEIVKTWRFEKGL